MTKGESSKTLENQHQFLFDAITAQFEQKLGPKLSALREELLHGRDERTVRRQRKERERGRGREKLEDRHRRSLSSRPKSRERRRQARELREERRGGLKLRNASYLTTYDLDPYLRWDKKSEHEKERLEVYHYGPPSSNQRSQEGPRRARSPREPREELGGLKLHKFSYHGELEPDAYFEWERKDKHKKESQIKEAEIKKSETKGSKTKASENNVVPVTKESETNVPKTQPARIHIRGVSLDYY